MWAERWEAWLWDGQVERVIAALAAESARLGPPQKGDGPEHPRRMLAQNVGYFTRHKDHMRYPEYRAKGWPIGSGVTEAAVKQFNKRVKGSEQFWLPERVEPILMLRALWISQDERWQKYWANRPLMSTDGAPGLSCTHPKIKRLCISAISFCSPSSRPRPRRMAQRHHQRRRRKVGLRWRLSARRRPRLPRHHRRRLRSRPLANRRCQGAEKGTLLI